MLRHRETSQVLAWNELRAFSFVLLLVRDSPAGAGRVSDTLVLQNQAMDRSFEPSEVDGEPISVKVHKPRLTHRFGTEPGKSWRPAGFVVPSSSSRDLDFSGEQLDFSRAAGGCGNAAAMAVLCACEGG